MNERPDLVDVEIDFTLTIKANMETRDTVYIDDFSIALTDQSGEEISFGDHELPDFIQEWVNEKLMETYNEQIISDDN